MTTFVLNPNRGKAQAPATAPFTKPAAQQAAGGAKSDKPKTQIWLNVGLAFPVPYSDEHPDGYVAYTTPYGMDVDTQNALAERGSADYIENVIQPKNAVLGKFVEMGFNLEAGESRVLTSLEFGTDGEPLFFAEIRRVKEVTTAPAASNSVVQMISGLRF